MRGDAENLPPHVLLEAGHDGDDDDERPYADGDAGRGDDRVDREPQALDQKKDEGKEQPDAEGN